MPRSTVASTRTLASSSVFSLVGTSPDVNSHQGVTTDGTYFFTIDTAALYKYDSSWNLVATNASAATEAGISHLGDGQYYNGKLYLAAENYSNETTFDSMRIAVFDAANLSFIEYHDVSAQGHEISSVCIDPDGGIIYASNYVAGSSVYKYSLSDFSYIGAITLDSTAYRTQGISFYKGSLWVSRGTPYLEIHKVSLDGLLVQNIPMSGFTELEGIDITTGTLYAIDDTGAVEYVKTYELIPSPTRTASRNITSTLRFSGSTYVTVPGLTPSNAAFGIGFWIYLPRNYTSFGRLFSWHDGSSGIEFFFRLATAYRLSYNANGLNNVQLVYGLGNRMFQGWHHLVINYDGTTFYAYLDGVLEGQRNDTFSVATGQTFTIGRNSSGSSNFLLSNIGDFVWRNGSMFSVDELSNLYRFNVVPVGSTVVLPFNEGSGTTATDASGNGNNGTIVSPTWSSDNMPSKARAASTSRSLVA